MYMHRQLVHHMLDAPSPALTCSSCRPPSLQLRAGRLRGGQAGEQPAAAAGGGGQGRAGRALPPGHCGVLHSGGHAAGAHALRPPDAHR
jgi:hypothetical protein